MTREGEGEAKLPKQQSAVVHLVAEMRAADLVAWGSSQGHAQLILHQHLDEVVGVSVPAPPAAGLGDDTSALVRPSNETLKCCLTVFRNFWPTTHVFLIPRSLFPLGSTATSPGVHFFFVLPLNKRAHTKLWGPAHVYVREFCFLKASQKKRRFLYSFCVQGGGGREPRLFNGVFHPAKQGCGFCSGV